MQAHNEWQKDNAKTPPAPKQLHCCGKQSLHNRANKKHNEPQGIKI